MDGTMDTAICPPIPHLNTSPPQLQNPTAYTFPDPFVLHTHTIILLHAKNQDGPDFQQELLESSHSSSERTLPQEFPSVKWVFPSAPYTYNSKSDQNAFQWYDMWDVKKPWEKGELQFQGLTEGEERLREVIEEEARILWEAGYAGEGRRVFERVLIGGISQGAAMALSVFLGSGRRYNLGGFMGLCGWMPLLNCESDCESNRPSELLERLEKRIHKNILSAPVHLEHSLGDDVVSYGTFKTMEVVLSEVGFDVQADEHEYEGHWIAEEKAVDSIAEWLFLEVRVPTSQFSGRRMDMVPRQWVENAAQREARLQRQARDRAFGFWAPSD